MKQERLTLLVPLTPEERNFPKDAAGKARLYSSVWGTVSTFLQKEMGVWFDGFHPATDCFGIPLNRLFAIVPGDELASLFIAVYAFANALQENAVRYHSNALLAAGETLDEKSLGSTRLVTKKFDAQDTDAVAHLAWLDGMSKGELVPGCSLYHYGFGRTQLSEKAHSSVLENLDNYALCMVELHLSCGEKEQEKDAE